MKNNRILNNVRGILRIAINSLYPPVCIFCEDVVSFEESSYREDILSDIAFIEGGLIKKEGFHRACLNKAKAIRGNICMKCGKSLKGEDSYCYDCQDRRHFFDRAVALFEYSELIKGAIYRFKYNNKKAYAYTFANLIAKRFKELIKMWGVDLIIGVPMNKEKERLRTFNQAELMAKELAKLMDMPFVKDFIIREKYTVPMKDIDRRDRAKNLEGAFIINKKIKKINKYRKVLIIDDIYTTGATLDACSKSLKKSGFERVYAITLCVGEGF